MHKPKFLGFRQTLNSFGSLDNDSTPAYPSIDPLQGVWNNGAFSALLFSRGMVCILAKLQQLKYLPTSSLNGGDFTPRTGALNFAYASIWALFS
jgi:hypothetical protein